MNKRLETAASFALGDVHKLVHEHLAIAPGISANDYSVADRHAAADVGDDLSAARSLRQRLVGRHRNSIDDQHSHPDRILDANPNGVGGGAGA